MSKPQERVRQPIKRRPHIWKRLSPKGRLYVDYALNLAREGRFSELVGAFTRVTSRSAFQKSSQLKKRWTRLMWRTVRPQSLIDAKTNRLNAEGNVVEKMSITFPSATAPLLASIIIPCFNYGRYLREAVHSALCQTVQSLEVIVVDDGSTDPDTHRALDNLASVSRVRVVRQKNGGLSSARNTGIAVANGEYICCLDADDTIEATYIEIAIAVMETDRSVGFAYSWVQLFGDENNVWKTRDFDIEEALIDNHTSVAAVFRRDDWMAVGGYRPDMRQGYEDWEFWLRLAALGRRGRAVRVPLFNHRRHGRTMTHHAHQSRHSIVATMQEHNPDIFRDSMRRRLQYLEAVPKTIDPLAILREPGVLARPDARPHLLIIAPGLADGGAETLLLDLLESLQAYWRFTIVTNQPDRQPWWSRFSTITTDIVSLHGAFAEESWSVVLEHIITARGTRVILSHGSSLAYSWFGTLKRQNPQIFTIDILHNDLASGHIKSAVIATDDIDTHIAVSPRIAQSLMNCGVCKDRIEVIANGADVYGAFVPDRFDQTDARALLDLPNDLPVLAWVGRLAEEKRPQAFLKIVAQVSTHKMPVVGLIIGDGPLSDRVNNAIVSVKDSGTDVRRIAQLPREEMAKIYIAADFLVLTSSIEGVPFVVLEAMACGCPVAATDVGDLNALIEHGQNGYLVPPSHPTDLANFISKGLADRSGLRVMRQAARDAISNSQFTKDKMLEAYSNLLARALNENDGRADTIPPLRSN